jgi:hypothetical protein
LARFAQPFPASSQQGIKEAPSMATELRRFGYPLITSIVLLAMFCGLTGSDLAAAGMLLAAGLVYVAIRLTRGAQRHNARHRRGLAAYGRTAASY